MGTKVLKNIFVSHIQKAIEDGHRRRDLRWRANQNTWGAIVAQYNQRIPRDETVLTFYGIKVDTPQEMPFGLVELYSQDGTFIATSTIWGLVE